MAPRIRCIKPELIEQDSFSALSDAAARLFIGMVTLADDEGRLGGEPAFLLGRVFFAAKPKRSARQVGVYLAELEGAGLITRYQVGRHYYVTINGWTQEGHFSYQRISHPRPSQIPAPSSISSAPDRGVIPQATADGSGSGSGSGSGKGMEGEREREARTHTPSATPLVDSEEEASITRVLAKYEPSYEDNQAARALVRSQLRAGYTEHDLRAVLAYCRYEREWGDKDDFKANLQPNTLLRPGKIEQHITAARAEYKDFKLEGLEASGEVAAHRRRGSRVMRGGEAAQWLAEDIALREQERAAIPDAEVVSFVEAEPAKPPPPAPPPPQPKPASDVERAPGLLTAEEARAMTRAAIAAINRS